MKHYTKIQCKWIEKAMYLIAARNGGHMTEELINDMANTNNAERFRVYYVLKYPSFVTRIVN